MVPLIDWHVVWWYVKALATLVVVELIPFLMWALALFLGSLLAWWFLFGERTVGA